MNKRNSIALLVVNACQLVAVMFVHKFLVAHVFMFSDYDIAAVGWFLLLMFPPLFVAQALSAVISRRFGAVHTKRLSSILFAAFIVCVIIFQDRLHEWYMWFGMFFGVAQGFFWGANNVLKTRVNDKSRLMGFVAAYFVIVTSAKLLFPVTFGLVIDNTALWVASAVVLVVCLFKFVATFAIKLPRDENCDRRLRVAKFLGRVREQKLTGVFAWFWVIQLVRKIGVTLGFWVTILIALEYGTQTWVGIFWSGFALVWMFVITFYKKAKSKIKNRLYWAVTGVILVVPAVIFFDVGFWGIMALQLAIIVQYVISLEEKTARLNLPKYLSCEEYVEECHLVGEVGKTIGRLTSAGLLVVVGLFGGNMLLFAIMVYVMIAALAVEAVILFFWNKRFIWNKKYKEYMCPDLVEISDEEDEVAMDCVCVKDIR